MSRNAGSMAARSPMSPRWQGTPGMSRRLSARSGNRPSRGVRGGLPLTTPSSRSRGCAARSWDGSDRHPDALDPVSPQGETEAGSGGGEDMAVLEGDLLLDQLVEQGIVAAGELDDGGAGRGDAEMEPGGEENGRAPEMRRHRDAVASRARGDALHLGEAAGDGGIGLEAIPRAGLQHLAKGEPGLLALARRDGNIGGAAPLRLSGQIVRRHRLFEPGEVVTLDLAGEPLGLAHAPGTVSV